MKNKLYYSLLLTSLCLPSCRYLSATETSFRQSQTGINSEKFLSIKQKIEENMPNMEFIKDKDITIILGNTGSGKSTMINVLAGTPMMISSSNGHLIPEFGKGRVKVRAGGLSCTKFPELITDTQIGNLCDLPGFQDSEGAIDDLLNASFIHYVLLHAHSVKTLILTTGGEIIEIRGRVFKTLSRFMNMFKNDAFRKQSCYLLVNRVDESTLKQHQAESLFENVVMETKDRFLNELKELGKIHFIPKTSSVDTTKSLEGIKKSYEDMVKIITNMKGMKLEEKDIDMSFTLNTETVNEINAFIDCILQDCLFRMKEDFYIEEIKKIKEQKTGKKASDLLREKRNDFLTIFKDRFKKTAEYQLLHPICGVQFSDRLSVFVSTFDQEHLSAVNVLVIDEMAEAKKIAEEETRKKEQEAEAAKIQAQKAEQEASEANKVRQEAEQKASEEKKKAEEAQRNAALSQKEKLAAQQKANAAELARQEADQKAQEALKTAKEATENAQKQIVAYQTQVEALKKQTDDMEKIYAQRIEAMERDMQRRQQETEQAKTQLMNQMASLREEQRTERENAKRELREIEEQHKRSMQEAEERYRKEKQSMDVVQNQQAHSIVYYLIPTPYGWVLEC